MRECTPLFLTPVAARKGEARTTEFPEMLRSGRHERSAWKGAPCHSPPADLAAHRLGLQQQGSLSPFHWRNRVHAPRLALGLGLCSSPAPPVGLCTSAPWRELKLLQCMWPDRAGWRLPLQPEDCAGVYVSACTHMYTLRLHLA